MLPHLIAQCQDIVTLAGIRYQAKLALVEHASGRIMGIVKDHEARTFAKRGQERVALDTPRRRPQLHEARYPAGTPDKRDIGIVKRLEQDDLVAWADQRHDRCRQRFRSARSHGDFFW